MSARPNLSPTQYLVMEDQADLARVTHRLEAVLNYKDRAGGCLHVGEWEPFGPLIIRWVAHCEWVGPTTDLVAPRVRGLARNLPLNERQES